MTTVKKFLFDHRLLLDLYLQRKKFLTLAEQAYELAKFSQSSGVIKCYITDLGRERMETLIKIAKRFNEKQKQEAIENLIDVLNVDEINRETWNKTRECENYDFANNCDIIHAISNGFTGIVTQEYCSFGFACDHITIMNIEQTKEYFYQILRDHPALIIKMLRKKRKYSQRQLAAQIGEKPEMIKAWENGEGFDELTPFFELAKVLNCTIDDLIEIKSDFSTCSKIRNLRETNTTLSQGQLAVSVGETSEIIQKWEEGQELEELLQFFKLAKVLECKVSDILSNTEVSGEFNSLESTIEEESNQTN